MGRSSRMGFSFLWLTFIPQKNLARGKVTRKLGSIYPDSPSRP